MRYFRALFIILLLHIQNVTKLFSQESNSKQFDLHITKKGNSTKEKCAQKYCFIIFTKKIENCDLAVQIDTIKSVRYFYNKTNKSDSLEVSFNDSFKILGSSNKFHLIDKNKLVDNKKVFIEKDTLKQFIPSSSFPEYIKGDEFLIEDLGKLLRNVYAHKLYEDLENNFRRKVSAKFVINEFGYIENIKLDNGFNNYLDNIIIQGVKKLKWIPAKFGYLDVKEEYEIPFIIEK